MPVVTTREADDARLNAAISHPGLYAMIEAQGLPDEPLTIVVESGQQVEAWVGGDGGSLSVQAADGTAFVLEIPPNAVAETTLISLVPIASIDNLPLSGGLMAGVDLAPDGLQLYRTATLTMELPSTASSEALIGFSYREMGEDLRLEPFRIDGARLTFAITHFSGYGAGIGSYAECMSVAAAASGRDRYLKQISCVGTYVMENPESSESWYHEELLRVLREWHQNVVVPRIQEAQASPGDLQGLTDAVSELLLWVAYAQLWGVDHLLSAEEDAAHGMLEAAYRAAVAHWDQVCIATDDVALKRQALDTTINVEASGQLMGYIDEMRAFQDICGGVLDRVATVQIDPEELILRVGAEAALVARPLTLFEDPPINLADKTVAWSTSNGAVASVTPVSENAPPYLNADVRGEGQGTATITAESEGVIGTAEVEVQDLTMSMRLREGLKLTAAVSSDDGTVTEEDAFEGDDSLEQSECHSWQAFHNAGVAVAASGTRSQAGGALSYTFDPDEKTVLIEWDVSASTSSQEGELSSRAELKVASVVVLHIENPYGGPHGDDDAQHVQLKADWEWKRAATTDRDVVMSPRMMINMSTSCGDVFRWEGTELFLADYRVVGESNDSGTHAFNSNSWRNMYVRIRFYPTAKSESLSWEPSQTNSFSGRVLLYLDVLD